MQPKHGAFDAIVSRLFVLALATLLSGCFGSDKPMFAPESAVRPLEPGRYGLFEQYGDQSKPSEYMEIRLRDNVYDFVNEKGAVNPVTFHPIAGGLHVAQVGGMPQADTDKKGYGYALFQIDGREALRLRGRMRQAGKGDARHPRRGNARPVRMLHR